MSFIQPTIGSEKLWSSSRDGTDYASRLIIPSSLSEVFVMQTCRYFGVSPTAFCRWKKRFDQFGEAGLAERTRAPHRSPRATSPAAVSKILYLRQNYHFGAPSASNIAVRFCRTGFSSSTALGEKNKRPRKGAVGFSGAGASPLRSMLSGAPAKPFQIPANTFVQSMGRGLHWNAGRTCPPDLT